MFFECHCCGADILVGVMPNAIASLGSKIVRTREQSRSNS